MIDPNKAFRDKDIVGIHGHAWSQDKTVMHICGTCGEEVVFHLPTGETWRPSIYKCQACGKKGGMWHSKDV